MTWQDVALITYALVGFGVLMWIDRRFKPPPWADWLLMSAVAAPGAWFLMLRLGFDTREAALFLPFVVIAIGFRMVVGWLVEKFQTRNDG